MNRPHLHDNTGNALPANSMVVELASPVIRDFLRNALQLGLVRCIPVSFGRVALLPTELWSDRNLSGNGGV